MTCLYKFLRKKSHASVVSPLTMKKTIGRILLFPSCATVKRRVPLYLPYNHVPSTWTMTLQYWNPSIHSLKLQKKITEFHETLYCLTLCDSIDYVSFSTTILGRNCCIACNNLDKSWNDLSQLSCFQWHFTCQRCFLVHDSVSFNAFDVWYQGWHWN